MKRDRRLTVLSSDHHQSLVLARRAARAAAGADTSAARVWDEVVRRFEAELAPHFEVEERYLLPALESGEHASLARRTRDEHAELRRLVHTSQEPVHLRLARFGAALQDHVRFEERELFPAFEAAASEEVLEAVAVAVRGRGCEGGAAQPC